ncbi:MAG TPA: cupredoxin family copper-binding protein [Longimicrobiales bacterium]
MLAATCSSLRTGGGRAAALLATVFILSAAPAARGQGLLDRSPNLAGGWIGRPGVVQFNFMHRFRVSDAPQRKVTNTPTFTLAAGLPWRTLLGVNYATNSVVAPNYPNEWELFGRALPLSQAAGMPLDVSVQLGYNVAAESVDGELALARAFGPVRLIAAGRMFSDGYHEGDARVAVAAGASIRLTEHLAVGGDFAGLVEREERALPDPGPGGDVEERAAWSVGVQLAIPYTPHTLSLHASNVNTTTLQGASRGGDGVMYGFEFTIPITLRRYLPSGGPEPVAAEPPPPEPAARDTAAAARREPVAGAAQITPAPQDSIAAKADSARAAVNADSARAANADSARAAAPAAPAKAAAGGARRPAAGAGRPARPARPSGRAPARREVVLEIRSLQFGTGRIEIDAGTTVVWKNADPVAHTATAADGSWDSGPIDPGKSWSRTFDRPGTYAYFCTPHPFMKAVVVVRGGGN